MNSGDLEGIHSSLRFIQIIIHRIGSNRLSIVLYSTKNDSQTLYEHFTNIITGENLTHGFKESSSVGGQVIWCLASKLSFVHKI